MLTKVGSRLIYIHGGSIDMTWPDVASLAIMAVVCGSIFYGTKQWKTPLLAFVIAFWLVLVR